MHINFTPKISKLTKDATEYLIFEISRLSSVQVVQLDGVNCSDGFARSSWIISLPAQLDYSCPLHHLFVK